MHGKSVRFLPRFMMQTAEKIKKGGVAA